jgi:hypothetical protein
MDVILLAQNALFDRLYNEAKAAGSIPFADITQDPQTADFHGLDVHADEQGRPKSPQDRERDRRRAAEDTSQLALKEKEISQITQELKRYQQEDNDVMVKKMADMLADRVWLPLISSFVFQNVDSSFDKQLMCLARRPREYASTD